MADLEEHLENQDIAGQIEAGRIVPIRTQQQLVQIFGHRLNHPTNIAFNARYLGTFQVPIETTIIYGPTPEEIAHRRQESEERVKLRKLDSLIVIGTWFFMSLFILIELLT